MKILLALDGSPCSRAALQEVLDQTWPTGSEVRVLSVAHPVPFIPDPLFLGAASYLVSEERELELANKVVAEAAEIIGRESPSLGVSTQVLEGSPKELIVEEAQQWGADRILVGSHGRGATKRLLLGSVAHTVALHAPCTVEILRSQAPGPALGISPTDGSTESVESSSAPG